MKKIIMSILIFLSIVIMVVFVIKLNTTKAVGTTLADTVIALSQGTSWSAGASGIYQTNGHEYRYVGANVNNYVSFNNDLYRIIGVFDSNSTGVSGNLVKLIRSRSIGGYSWGVTNAPPDYTTYSTFNNNWETANLNILLNEYWLNASNTSSTYGQCENWTYYYSENNGTNDDYKTKDCSDIVGYGIQTEELRNYIQPVTWYLKGLVSGANSEQEFYTCERSDTTTISNCRSLYATKVENKDVGLMYVSDYLYASGYYSSSGTTGTSSYLGQQNWLYNGYEWTITPGDGGSMGIFLIYNNVVSPKSPNNLFDVRPTFYLKSSVYVTGGNGSFHNPYTIACDNCSV